MIYGTICSGRGTLWGRQPALCHGGCSHPRDPMGAGGTGAAPTLGGTTGFIPFQFLLPGTSVISTSKGCTALLNDMICLTASLIESWQGLFVQVGFTVTSLFYFDWFCVLGVVLNSGSAMHQWGWAGAPGRPGVALGLLCETPAQQPNAISVPEHPSVTDAPEYPSAISVPEHLTVIGIPEHPSQGS